MTMEPSQSQTGFRPDFGRKLTQREYERSVIALHSPDATPSDRSDEPSIRRAELDLLVDYRLGVDFPRRRRAQLWEVQQALDRRRIWHVLLGVLSSPLNPSRSIASAQVRAFAKVLHPTELGALLELSDEELQLFL